VVLEFSHGGTGDEPLVYLLSGENQEHLYLCAYNSAFLTISSLRGLAQSLEETTEHRRGC